MPIRINLLAEAQAAAELRRKDPVKRGIWVGSFLVLVVVIWIGKLQFDIFFEKSAANSIDADLKAKTAKFTLVTSEKAKIGEIDGKLAQLDILSTNRFLWAPVFNALQKTMVDDVQVTRLTGDQIITKEEGHDIGSGSSKKHVPGAMVEKISLVVEAKDLKPGAENYTKFKESLCTFDFFAKRLQRRDGFVMDGILGPLTVDPVDPSKQFRTFTLASHFPEYAAMNKLTKAQREQLISIAIGAVALMAALWYFGVTAKEHELAVTLQKTAETKKKLHDAETLMRQEEEITSALTTRSNLLAKREAGLAPDRDAYAWLINTTATFIQSRKGVNIDTVTQPEISEVGIIPRFPYRWATFHLKGTGYYHDLGKFFADFENTFPYFRIQNPMISANSGPGVEAEKLSVSFDIVAPVASTSQ